MDDPARVAIIGSGNVTHFYLAGAALFPSIELTACADLDPARAEALSAAGGFPARTVDDILARIRTYIDIGIQGLIVEMPSPLDLETIRALARDVRPQLG